MFTLPHFCRVCLKYDKNLIDLAHIENEPNETLLTKLQQCVSEVEWGAFKPLLCHPCIKRLNIAYGFKKQCIQSAGVLKNYIELVKESQKKNSESPNVTVKGDGLPPSGAFMLLPNQKYVKILVGSQNQGTTGNTFQNVFLNLIPSTALNATTPTLTTNNTSTPNSKDTNQNVFLNINNTFQKFIPIAPIDPKKNDSKKPDTVKSPVNPSVSVNQLLTESKAEEMSVEIDPTSFLQLDQGASESDEEKEPNDWDEVISKSKIDPKQVRLMNGEKNQNGKEANFVPILPKQEDFFSGQHFLSSSFEAHEIVCEACQKPFATLRLLKQHIKEFHMGKVPFKCEYCYTEYVTREPYELCLKSHKAEYDQGNEALTLKDFANISKNSDLNISLVSNSSAEQNLSPNEDGEFPCTVCGRLFNSSTGLLRHRVRKHNQKNKKKYFIKGMKNARCDICQREFSTQSYMQLHRKLHLRDDIGYKYKVLGKSAYGEAIEGEPSKDKDEKNNDDTIESSNEATEMKIEPEIKMEIEDDKCDESKDEDEDSDSNDEEEVPAKKIKLSKEKENEKGPSEKEAEAVSSAENEAKKSDDSQTEKVTTDSNKEKDGGKVEVDEADSKEKSHDTDNSN